MKLLNINLIPKFIDEAMSPVAKSVGNSVSNLWELAFGNHVELWVKKQEFKHQLNYEDYVNKINEKLNSIPSEDLVEPQLNIIGPAIEASKYYIDSEELREMFANLIVASMNNDKVNSVHPSYVEIIKQLNSDEAKILKNIEGDIFPLLSVSYKHENGLSVAPIFKDFSDIAEKSGCEHPIKILAYLDNLKRLGLISFHDNVKISNDEPYEKLKEHELIKHHAKVASVFGEPVYINSCAQVTTFGKIFRSICIQE